MPTAWRDGPGAEGLDAAYVAEPSQWAASASHWYRCFEQIEAAERVADDLATVSGVEFVRVPRKAGHDHRNVAPGTTSSGDR